MSFYHVPKFIFNPIAAEGICQGRILLPTDFDGQLAEQLKGHGIESLVTVDNKEAIQDPEWWLSHKGHVDWVVAITQGMGELTDWVTDYGLEVASKGVCLLDRITFLEPTRKREPFLTNSSLTNLKILSPRPSFRADGKQLKDSVTSAWFIFHKAGAANVSTNIDFEVGWQRPKSLRA
jgi:hypothetical protein